MIGVIIGKRKGTEEIVTLLSRSYGSSGSRVTIMGADGISAEFEESSLRRNLNLLLDFHAVKGSNGGIMLPFRSVWKDRKSCDEKTRSYLF